ncbi:MAG TPA: MarR family transcriptional regulator [Mycobacteriales bacterium]|nr:MarR family transcriptional regulator [Mycobacteriales bacterium]
MEDSATELLVSASRALVAIAARSLGRVEDQVTLPQYRALVVLATRGALRPVDLADALDVTPSTATRMCDRLVRKGLMERAHRDSDRREVELRLSAEGRRLVNEVTARRRRDLRRVLSRISASDQASLIQALRVFTDAAGEATDTALGLGLSL